MKKHRDTQAIHLGEGADPHATPLVTPIYQTSTFLFDDTAEVEAYQAGRSPKHIYSRYGNPTVRATEAKVAALEGGTAALAVASGHAAQVLAFHCLMRPGDEFVASRKLYGGSINQFNQAYKSFNWTPKWADPDDLASFEAAIGPRGRAACSNAVLY